MSAELNHTIVWARDKDASAAFLAEILGAGVRPNGPFAAVTLANNVTLDFGDAADVAPQHYAFLLSEEEFDAAFARVRAGGLDYWADPLHEQPGQINHWHGGRGVYFEDPDRHNLELLTRE